MNATRSRSHVLASALLACLALCSLFVAGHLGGCLGPSQAAKLEALSDADFETFAQSMEADAELAAIFAVREGVDPARLIAFARAVGGSDLRGSDAWEDAATQADIEELMLRSLLAKLRLALRDSPVASPRSLELQRRVAGAIILGARRGGLPGPHEPPPPDDQR